MQQSIRLACLTKANPPARRRHWLYVSTAIGTVLAIATAAPGRADTYTWDGRTSTDWFDPRNWTVIGSPNPTVPPKVSDDVSISGNGKSTVVGAGTANAHDITVTNGASIAVTGGATPGVLSYSGLTISGGGQVSGEFENSDNINVLVTGTNSALTLSQDLTIGNASGLSTVTVGDGGRVSTSSITIAAQAGSFGTLTVGAAVGQAAVAPGTIDTPTIAFGQGSGTILFNHTSPDYTFAPAISGIGTIRADSGATKLTADSSGFLGAIQVYGGELGISGRLGFGGPVIVDGGVLRVSGTLSGAGVAPMFVENGTLFVENGGTITIGQDAYIEANRPNDIASVVVTGAGSHLTSNRLFMSGVGFSTLTIQNQGRVDSQLVVIGQGAGSSAVLVSGSGSSWTIANSLSVGNLGPGSLRIEKGAAVSAGSVEIGSSSNFSSGPQFGTGVVTVTGAGSLLESGDIRVGGYVAVPGTGPIGTLSIADNGKVSANNLLVAEMLDSTGTLNIGAAASEAAVAPGTLDTPEVAFGRGTGKIVFNHTAQDYSFAPLISGAGAVDVLAGRTILTANNTYTGPTTVNGGILSVNGSIAASEVTVNAGGTLGGNGTVGNTLINGGTLAPGNSIGLLTVQGNLVFTAASTYLIEVSPSNADRTNVTGTATLGGATANASFAPGSYIEKTYTILNATGGVSGTFTGPINTNLPQNFASTLSYDPNNAYLNLTLSYVAPTETNPPSLLPCGGLNINQCNVATALVGSFNRNGGIPLAFGALSPAGLTQVSGETATGAQQSTFNAMSQFMGVMTDPFVASRGDTLPAQTGPAAYTDQRPLSATARDALAAIDRKAPIAATYDPRWSTWAAGFGGAQTTDGNTTLGSNRTTSDLAAVAAGADYRISPNTIAGFALAGGGTSFSVANGGTGRSDLFQAGAFIRHSAGAAYVVAAAAYGYQDITTDRTVTAAGADRLHAELRANAYSGRIEGGFRALAPWTGGIGITPYAAGQFTTFNLPAYAESVLSGASTFALAYNARSVTDGRSELGIRTDRSFAVQDAMLTLRGRFAWAHDFNPDRAIAATFQTLPGASFVVNGASQPRDSALTTASAELRWRNGWSAAASFEGEFADTVRSYAGKGVVRYSW